ncbi:mitochondrial inner membrane protein OXA1L isoform X2 [Brachionichthys hirsutus]|uniref:mitochondrial inner membrane protein OXA1L isoform X2 n=1 Tax=Brachionichthys hirsutus TaxID=412623 RepID=UPI0036049D62
MAAIRSGVTSSHLARCLLGKTGKLNRGSHPRLLQRSLLHTAFQGRGPVVGPHLHRRRHGKFFWVNAVAVRHNSSQIPAGTLPTAAVNAAPSPPPPLDSSGLAFADPAVVLTQPVAEQVAGVAPTAAEVLQAAASNPSLAELGLAAHTPVGLIQNFLEFLHVDVGLPWWGAIASATLLARLLIFPIIVKGQREAAKLNNIFPEMNKLTEKMNEAKSSGNSFEFSKAYSDLRLFQKQHDVNILRNFLIPLAQLPVFLSFFIALRQMSYLPVPSLRTGGALWFTDLTVADPFYILPLVATGTVFFILELNAEMGVSNPKMQQMKAVFRIMPFVILPFIIKFPTALFVYWVTSNAFSLGQVALLNQPLIREKLRIPVIVKHRTATQPDSDGFIVSVKRGWKNAKLAHDLQERERRVGDQADLAAKGPLRQTFPNPIKKTETMTAASAANKTGGKKAKPRMI